MKAKSESNKSSKSSKPLVIRTNVRAGEGSVAGGIAGGVIAGIVVGA